MPQRSKSRDRHTRTAQIIISLSLFNVLLLLRNHPPMTTFYHTKIPSHRSWEGSKSDASSCPFPFP